jgi:uncharacterized protein YndB with AHSA1/START domain
MSDLSHRLDRTLMIQAAPETVFSYFTQTPKWAAWWGAGSTIDPHPGGALTIRYPGGTEAVGNVLEVRAPERIVFTYGYPSGRMIAPGGSRVTIALERHAAGTRLMLTHEFADAATRDLHVQGWRYQLSVFANVVADAQQANAAAAVDAWFDMWADSDAAARTETLARIATPELQFRDRYSNTDGVDDLVAHITAAQHFMPGIRMRRAGDIRHCQGTVLAEWIADGPDGRPRASGTNVFVFTADGRIESVTGFMTLIQQQEAL